MPRLESAQGAASVELWRPFPSPAFQSVDGLFHRYRGIWLREDRRPFLLRKFVNQKVLAGCNRWLFDRQQADVYLSTYYGIPPNGVPGVAFVYDMIYERFPDAFGVSDREMLFAKKKQCFLSSDLLLCISQQTKDDLIDYYNVPAEKCRVCYLGGCEFAAGNLLSAQKSVDECEVLYVGDW